MMEKNELTYWVAYASMRALTTRQKNSLYVKCYTAEPRISITELFENRDCWSRIGLNEAECAALIESRETLESTTFVVEDLLAQGYEIIPIDSSDYSRTLKANLKQNAPTVLYVKGDKSLLNKPSVAIVGSRSADALSLAFTNKVAASAVEQRRVVVSGYAKGVDRQALDSTLENNGSSVIVLPQGIMTFGTGYKQYYKDIMSGKLLVVSYFPPKMPWSVACAMARNAVIYAMADEIYVAQSDSKGGTWAGVLDGLKKSRKIYVRQASSKEKNANNELIRRGAIAVDAEGKVVPTHYEVQQTLPIDFACEAE